MLKAHQHEDLQRSEFNTPHFLNLGTKGDENCGQRSDSYVLSDEAVTLHLVAKWLGPTASLAWPFVMMERRIPNLIHKTYFHVTYISTDICIHYGNNFGFTKIVVLFYIILLVKKFVPKYVLYNHYILGTITKFYNIFMI